MTALEDMAWSKKEISGRKVVEVRFHGPAMTVRLQVGNGVTLWVLFVMGAYGDNDISTISENSNSRCCRMKDGTASKAALPQWPRSTLPGRTVPG
jgi:hypothetical protein